MARARERERERGSSSAERREAYMNVKISLKLSRTSSAPWEQTRPSNSATPAVSGPSASLAPATATSSFSLACGALEPRDMLLSVSDTFRRRRKHTGARMINARRLFASVYAGAAVYINLPGREPFFLRKPCYRLDGG